MAFKMLMILFNKRADCGVTHFQNKWIFKEGINLKMTGIKERRTTAPGINVVDMAFAAGKAALQDANLIPSQIDFVLLSIITQDRNYPSIACRFKTASVSRPQLGI
jgi:3-oxoacyl-[acyl-carrier-protein] synthase III